MDAFKDLQYANAELAGSAEPVVKADSVALQIYLIERRRPGAFLDCQV